MSSSNPPFSQHVFNFSIVRRDTTNDPLPNNVDKIEITNPPHRTTYFEGEPFDDAGMVVIATLKNGDTAEVNGFAFSEEPFQLGDTEITISFGEGEHERIATQPITVKAGTGISDVKISNGQLFGDYEMDPDTWNLAKKENRYHAVALYDENVAKYDHPADSQGKYMTGRTVAKFSFRASDAAEVSVLRYGETEDEKLTADAEGLYHVDLPAGEVWNSSAEGWWNLDGMTSIVTVKAGELSTEHTFTCFAQQEDGMPAEVTEYLCMASQYTNGASHSRAYGLNPERSLRGLTLDATVGSNYEGPTSLGNFGGYIVYRYDEPITDNPNNPYGVDFLVFGNCVDPNKGFSEPGNVLVSEDGTSWYTLAGSAHYEDYAKWNYSLIYKNQTPHAAWEAPNGTLGKSYKFPDKKYYPLFPWDTWDKDPDPEKQITLTGTLLDASGTDEYGSASAAFPDFGYADTGRRAYDLVADNPYTGLDQRNWRTSNEGFDLKWAVDENGKPVDLSGKEIKYVKIQSANNVDAGGIGEKSPSINGMRVVDPSEQDVRVTDQPVIKIDGEMVAVADGEVTSRDITTPFLVQVDTNAANVYINGVRGKSRAFVAMPDHGMLRVIVQDGDEAPWIGYVTLNDKGDGSGSKKTASVIKFNTVGGSITGATTRAYMPLMSDDDKKFPIPTRYAHTFLYWMDEDGKKQESYNENMSPTLTLTAQWQFDIPADMSGPGYGKILDAAERALIEPSNASVNVSPVMKALRENNPLDGRSPDGDGVIKTYEAIEKLMEDGAIVYDAATHVQVANAEKVLEGMSPEAREALDLGTSDDKLLPLPVFEATIPYQDRANGEDTVLVSMKVFFGEAFAGTNIGSIVVLKLKPDGTTTQLSWQPDPDAITHGQYAWTYYEGQAISPEYPLSLNFEAYFNVAIRDRSDLDWDYETENSVIDPIVLAIPGKSSTITFDTNGGAITGENPRAYKPSTPDKTFPIPTRDGYTFEGWFDAQGNRYDRYYESMPPSLTLTARWKQNVNVPENNSGAGYGELEHPNITPADPSVSAPVSFDFLPENLDNGWTGEGGTAAGVVETVKKLKTDEAIRFDDVTKAQVANEEKVIAGLTDAQKEALNLEADDAAESGKLLSLPPFVATIPESSDGTDKKDTVLVSTEVTFGEAFDGKTIGSIAPLKLKPDGNTIRLTLQSKPENIKHGEYAWTNDKGEGIQQSTVLHKDDTAHFNVAIRDDSELDWDKTTPNTVIDPIVLADTTPSEGGGTSGGGSGGCDTGPGLAAIGLLMAVAALRSRKRG
jgi:uncharacterized repeat protein (TIGR02543 family)